MNEVTVFNDKYMATMQRYAELEQTIKELEQTKKAVRAEIQEAMEFYNIRSFENDILKLTLVAPSVSKSIDSAALRIADPDVYEDLMERFPKVIEKRQSLRVNIK